MRIACLLVCLLATLAQAEVYKSINEDGEVVYSDRPGENAERLRMPALPTYTPQPVRSTSRISNTERTLQPEAYDSFEIASPADDSTIRNNIGSLEITTLISPALMVPLGHSIQFYIDGNAHGAASDATTLSLTNVDRGSHQLSASVLDANDRVLISTPPVTVHLKRASKLHGNREGTVTDNPGYLTENPNRVGEEDFQPYRVKDIADFGRDADDPLDPDIAEQPANPGYRNRNPNVLSPNPNIHSSNPNLINPPVPSED
jgi:hypothetical protein